MSKTSISVFRSFLVSDSEGNVDASGIVSIDCFRSWLQAHKKSKQETQDYRKFHRALTNHISGVDGRIAFEPREESAILTIIRKRTPWPCFPDANLSWGYRGKGFHEKKASPPPIASPMAEASSKRIRQESPAVLLPPEPDESQMFAYRLVSYVQSFSSFGYDVWRSGNGVMRFLALSIVGAADASHVTKERAEWLCEQATALAPDCAVMVSDITCKEFEKRCLAQNALSVTYFGPIVGHFKDRLMQKEDLFSIIVALLSSLHQPGTPFPVRLGMKMVHDGRIQPMSATFCTDPESFLVVFTAEQVPRRKEEDFGKDALLGF